MPPLRYAAEAVGLLGIAWGIVRWIGRWARDLGSEGDDDRLDRVRFRAPAPVRFTAPHPVPAPRRAVGLDVHCPACGTPLVRETLQLSGRAACDGCSREVTAYIRRGRLTVIVQETAEESERRTRVDADLTRRAPGSGQGAG